LFQVISILGETLAPFASSGFIAAFGFGDVKTSDHSVFPLKTNGYCKDFAEVWNFWQVRLPGTF
uniref:Copine domain-containing protein n=1 Tax=Soboliphyme baturini TaxID=241478 RepID=A0A183JAL1_9BILA